MGLFRRKKSKRLAEMEPTEFAQALSRTFATTSKQLVWIFSINGIAWIWCSYILAFRGAYQIAESLSSSVCQIVIGQIGFYLVTSTIENVFKYNSIFKRKSDKQEEETNHVGKPEPPEPPKPGEIDFGAIGSAPPDDSSN